MKHRANESSVFKILNMMMTMIFG